MWGCHMVTVPCLVPSPSRRCGWMAAGATPFLLSCGATRSHWAWLCSRAGSSGPMAQSWCRPPRPLPRSTQCCSVHLSRLSLCCMSCSSLPVSTLLGAHTSAGLAAPPPLPWMLGAAALAPGAHRVLPDGSPGPAARDCGLVTEGTYEPVGKLLSPMASGRAEPSYLM